MESCSCFSGDQKYAFDKTVTESSENGGKHSVFVASSEADHEKLSRVVVENISSGDSSIVDLKLWSASNQKETLSLNSFPSKHNSSYATPKRSYVPFCQVYGCRKDLRSSKEYYKKHKVCEVHSKTAKVIVNGVEQRFCQQCSRFHVLEEFDNGKRSCRIRLADHNMRRRKPRVGVNSTGLGDFQDYNGFRFPDTTSTSVRRNRLTGGLLYQQKYEVDYWNRPVKLDHDIGHPSHFHGFVESKNSTFMDSSSSFQDLSGMLNSGRALSLLSAHSSYPLVITSESDAS